MLAMSLLVVVLLGVLRCHAMPPQESADGHRFLPVIQERDVVAVSTTNDGLVFLDNLEPSDEMEALAIHYAANNQLDEYFELAVQLTLNAGDHELVQALNGELDQAPELTQRDNALVASHDARTGDPCVTFLGSGRAAWHNQSLRQHILCYSKYFPGGLRASRPVVRAAGAIILQRIRGRTLSAQAGLTLLKKAKLSDGGQQTVAIRDDQSLNEMSASNIFGIHFPFFDKVAHILTVITTTVVGITVCAENVIEPPAFFLLAGVVWSLCIALLYEIPVSVVETVACFNYENC